MTGITFQGGDSGPNWKYSGTIGFAGTSHSIVRLDHMHFLMTTYSDPNNRGSCSAFTGVYGVVDHNIFDLNGTDDCLRFLNNFIENGGLCRPTGLGGPDFMFVEDNQFNNGLVDDCQAAGNLFRLNQFTASGIQVHPTGSRSRGCRDGDLWEYLQRSDRPATIHRVFCEQWNWGYLGQHGRNAGLQQFRLNLNSMSAMPTRTRDTDAVWLGLLWHVVEMQLGRTGTATLSTITRYPVSISLGAGKAIYSSMTFQTSPIPRRAASPHNRVHGRAKHWSQCGNG